jgi:hypothetical protein
MTPAIHACELLAQSNLSRNPQTAEFENVRLLAWRDMVEASQSRPEVSCRQYIAKQAPFDDPPLTIQTERSGARAEPINVDGPHACLLKNRTYIGEPWHKSRVFDGEYKAIINGETFERVQKLMKDHPAGRSARRRESGALLTRLIYEDRGNRLSRISQPHTLALVSDGQFLPLATLVKNAPRGYTGLSIMPTNEVYFSSAVVVSVARS